MSDRLKIKNYEFDSRLFLGTGKFSSNQVMSEAIQSSKTQMVTVALKRVDVQNSEDDMLKHIDLNQVKLIPNTSGVRNAKEAIFLAKMARDALETDLLKLEIHPDPRYLLPDPIETLNATEQLAKDGFVILPYVNADPVLCKRLEEVGSSAVMPLGSPIGSNQGLKTKSMLEIIIEQSTVPVIVDAGIGKPSHAAEALEIGADAVLVNTAIAVASDPVLMAYAFQMAVQSGRKAYTAGMGVTSNQAAASSPLTSFLN